MYNRIKGIVVGLLLIVAPILVVAPPANAKIHVNHGFGGSKKVAPNTICHWGPAQSAAPSDWQELRCGTDPKPFALGNKDLSDVSIARPVAYIDELKGSTAIVSIQTSTKEFFIEIPKSRLPKDIKEEQWFTVDSNTVKMVRSLDRSGDLISLPNHDD